MLGWIGKIRRRLYRVEETAVRVEQLQSEVADLRRTIASGDEETRRLMAENHDRTYALLSEAREIAYSAQMLAGEGLSSTNEWRERGLQLLWSTREMAGRALARQLADSGDCDWIHNQFSVYSQFGEDGLIQLLVREIPIAERVFVEFGVEDYKQATTRFLLINDRWTGLVMDGSAENIAALQAEPVSGWRDLKSVTAFITRENIDQILADAGFAGPIGLLSVDIDGNDYWVWEAITAVDPVIVIVEYNYRFGPDLSVAVPYDPEFVKTEAHPSAIYYGASLAALCDLGAHKGYAFVGCSAGGVNAFFVRRDRRPDTLPERTAVEGYVAGQHAEMRGPDGRVRKASLEEQRDLLLTLPLVHFR